MTGISRVGIAVLGAGRIGAQHAINVARETPGATLVGVADIDIEAATRAVTLAGAGRATTQYEELLGDQHVGAVIIATPTATHAALMIEAARAGKHILCEKPIALTLQATNDAIAQLASAPVFVQIGFQRRFDPAFARAREAIVRGEIGVPWIVKLVGRDPRLAPISYLQSSGGLFIDQAIHEYDLAGWLMGAEVDEVFATGSALIDPALAAFGDIDTALTTLRFTGGALGLVDNSRQAVYGYDVRAEVHGSAGKVMMGQEAATAVTLLKLDRASHDHVDWFLDRFAFAYKAEVADFVACIHEGRPPRVGIQEGLRALRIALAAGLSYREHRPVSMNELESSGFAAGT